MQGGGAFALLLKKSAGDPYLKTLDFSKIFIADAPMKKKSTNFVLSPLRALLGNPVQKYLKIFCLDNYCMSKK